MERRCLAAAMLLAAAAMPMAARAETKMDTPIYMKDFDAFRNKTLEQKVQELADREEIRDLIARYAHRVAHGKPFADLFTEDGSFVTHRPGRAGTEIKGRQNLEKYFGVSAAAVEAKALPMIHNYVIEISGDEARGICSNELRIEEDGKSIIASGYYEDRYRRENGRWRFASRAATFYHWVPVQEGWVKAKKD